MPPRKKAAASTPAISFFPFQQRWIDDRSRLKIANKARQIGFSFSSAYEAVEDCLVEPRKGEKVPTWPPKWYCLSTTERQAAELIETCAKHAKAFGAAASIVSDECSWEGFRFKHLTVELPTGGRIVGLPANPITARGSSGNLLLDEYAHHHDPDGIHRAVLPVISRGYKVRIQSTPAGKRGRFYQVWTHGGQRWSRHQIDIYQAVAEGYPVDIEELREAVGNPDDWAQEYECQFLDEAHAWLTYDMIDSAEDLGATTMWADDFKAQGPLYCGIDIGRKRDLTVIWVEELLGDVRWTRVVLELDRVKFRDQLAIAEQYVKECRRTCVDATGIGAMLAEELVNRFGSRVEPVVFTNAVKADLAAHIKDAYEDRRVRIPTGKAIREDLHSVKKVTTVAGNVRFDAERSDAGHADRFWAQALCEHAASDAAQPFDYRPVERMQSSGVGEALFGVEPVERKRRKDSWVKPPPDYMGRGGIW